MSSLPYFSSMLQGSYMLLSSLLLKDFIIMIRQMYLSVGRKVYMCVQVSAEYRRGGIYRTLNLYKLLLVTSLWTGRYTCVCRYTQSPEEGIQSSRAGRTGTCTLTTEYQCQEANSSPLIEQCLLLTADHFSNPLHSSWSIGYTGMDTVLTAYNIQHSILLLLHLVLK